MWTFGIIGGQELWIILVIVVLLFGASKIPQLMRSLGQGVREFRKVSREMEDSLDEMKQPIREIQSTVSEAKSSVVKAIDEEVSRHDD